ncbi:MAG: hypothetical protein V4702_01240 [Patescibacteria group bacterium]
MDEQRFNTANTGQNDSVSTPISGGFYDSAQIPTPAESLEMHEQNVVSQAQTYSSESNFRGFSFSRRKAMIVSIGITIFVILITGASILFFARRGSDNQLAQQATITPQDISLKDANLSTIPKELNTARESLLVNGDLATRGELRFSNGNYATTLKTQNSTADQTFILPNASGTLCLDSNNCNLATQAALNQTNATLALLQNRLGQVVVPAIPASSLVNNQVGVVTVQGTANQITVSTANGTITLAGPQDLAQLSSPTFAGLTLNGNLSMSGMLTLPLNCSVLTNGGTLTTNGSGQVICANDDGGAGAGVTTGGGTAGTIPVFTSATNIENSLLSQALGVVSVAGDLSASGNISAVAFSGNGSALTALNASNMASGTLNDLRLSANVSLLGPTISNLELVNSSLTVTAGSGLTNGGSVALGAATTLNIGAGNGITVNADDITLAIQANKGLEVDGNGLSLIDCGLNQILKYNGANQWACDTDSDTTGAPNSAAYVTVGNDGTLTGERAITPTGNLIGSDGGANSTYSINTINNPTFSSSVTTPLLQSSGALSITPGGALTVGATGQTALLQGSTTTITSNGAGNDIVLTSADQVRLTGLNCTTFANGGVLTTDASGNIGCQDDNGDAASGITGTGNTNRIAYFSGAQTIADSWLLQNGSTLELDNTRNLSLLGGNFDVTGTGTFSGTLTANGNLAVQTGDTFTFNGDAFTDLTGTGLTISSGSLQTTLGTSVDLASAEVTGILPVGNGGTGVNGSAAANGQLLIGNGTGYTLATLTQGAGITISNASGSITVTNNFGTEVDLGTETAGNYQASTTGGNGIAVTGTPGEGWTAALGLSNLTANWTQTGAFDIVLDNAASELSIRESSGAFYGTLDVGDLTADRTYTLPNYTTGTGTICLDSGNCAGAGGGITGSGTQNQLSKFGVGGNNIVDSTISDDGTNVTTSVDIIVQGGSATLGTITQGASIVLHDGDGETITLNLPDVSTSYSLLLPGAVGSANQCLKAQDGSGTLFWDACLGGGGGGGLTSIDGQTGPAVTINNATGSSNVITIDDAAADGTTKGIAAFNATNFSAASGVINTIQGISTAATPQFAGLTLTSNLSIGANSIITSGATLTSVELEVLDGGITEGEVSGVITDVTAGAGLTGGAASGNATLTVASGNGGIVVNADDITLTIQANKGLEVDGSGLSLIDCSSGEVLKYNGSNQWACAADNGGGSGDNISVNSTAADDANFLNVAATGTSTATTWTLVGASTPDDISLAIGNASATEAGAVTTGAQTFAGVKTFNNQIVAGGGISLGSQTLQGTTAVIDFTNFDVSSAGAVTAVGVNAGSGLLQGTGGITVGGTATFSSLTNGFLEVDGSGVVSVGTIDLGTDTNGNYVATITAGNGISGTSNTEGGTPTIALSNLTADWLQSGAFDITLDNSSSELKIRESSGAFYAILDVADLAADQTFTLNEGGTVVTSGNVASHATTGVTAGSGLTGGGTVGVLTLNVASANGGIVANANDIALTLQASKGLEVDGNGLSLIDCANGEVLKYETTGNTWICATDGTGTGDDVSVNGTGATGANFLSTAATGTSASVTWTLNVVTNPDDITLAIGNASATEAGAVTTGAQAFAGVKTFNNQIVAGGGIDLAAQTLQGTTAVIDFTNFDVTSGGNTTIAGTLAVQGATATVGTAALQGSLALHDGSGQTLSIRSLNQAANRIVDVPIITSNDTFCLLSLGNCFGTGTGGTLQAAYNAGNTITTTDARNLLVTLANTTTDSSFFVNIASGSNGKFSVQNAGVDAFNISVSGGFTGVSLWDSTNLAVNDGLTVLTGHNSGVGETVLTVNARTSSNLLQLVSDNDAGGIGSASFTVNRNGHTTLQNQLANSTTAFQVLATAGEKALVVDTTNSRVGIAMTALENPSQALTFGNGNRVITILPPSVGASGQTGGNLGIHAAKGFGPTSPAAGGYLDLHGGNSGISGGNGGNAYLYGGTDVVGTLHGNTILAYDIGAAAAIGKVGIGTNTPNATLHVLQQVATSGTPLALRVRAGAHTGLTASTESIDVDFDLSRSVSFATGALATQRAFVIQAPTYNFTGSSTITNAATAAITGPPGTGSNATITNSHALLIQNFSVGAAGITTNAYGLTVNAPTNATGNSYVAQFLGGNVGIGDTSPAYLLTVGNNDKFGVTSAGDLKFEGTTNDANNFTITAADPTASRTYTIPNSSATTDTFCLLTLNNCASSTTLQSAYNADADGSDAIIALTTADDSIIIRNPASSGSDSTYPLTVDQLNTGAFGGMFINSLGTGYALRVDDSSGDTTPFVIDQNGQVGIGTTTLAADLTFGGGVDRSIVVGGNSGGNLTIVAGANTGGTPGRLILRGGNGGAIGSGNNVYVAGGSAAGGNGNVILAHDGTTALGNVGIGDASPAALLTVGSGDLFKVDSSGFVQGNVTTTGTTGNTESTPRTNVTTVTIDAAGSFANNDIIWINNAGQDYYTRIVSGGGTTTLTVSPAVSYDADITITKVNAQSIGATSSAYSTDTNRYFQGYFLGGVVTGAGSTTLSDGNLSSTGNLVLQGAGGNVGIGTTNPTATLHVAGANGNNAGTGGAAPVALRVVGGTGGNGSSGPGGVGADLVLSGGTGGNGSSGNFGGNGGNISITAGNGGDSSNLVARPNGGNITLQAGAQGTGGNSDGVNGNINLQTTNGVVNITGSRVGINISNPNAAFEVLSTSANSAYITADTGAAAYTTTSLMQGLTIRNTNTNSTGFVGISFASSAAANSGNATIGAVRTGTDSNALVFATRCNGCSTTERARIDQSGSLGIGTTAPASMLSVGASNQFQVDSTGNILASGNLISTGNHTLSQGANRTISVAQASSGNGYNLTVQAGSANAGGTGGDLNLNGGSGGSGVSPGGNVRIQGGASGNGTNGGNVYIDGGTTSGTPGNILFSTVTAGRVGIGLSGPSALLHVSGTGGGSSLLRVTDTTATARDVFDIADGGATTFRNQTDSTTAFQIQNAAGTNLLVADTTNSRLQVGSTTADATGALLVLDTKNTAGDPTGVNGATYYNSNTNKFRCFENSAWADCITSASASTLQGAYNADADGSDATIALTTADDSLIFSNPAASGSDSDFVLKVTQLATGASKSGLLLTSAGGSSGYALRVNDDGTDTDSTPFIIDNAGNVGIGLASPTSILHILGPNQATAGAAAVQTLQVTGGTGGNGTTGAGGAGSLLAMLSGTGGVGGVSGGGLGQTGGAGGALTLTGGTGGAGGNGTDGVAGGGVGALGGAINITSGAGGQGGSAGAGTGLDGADGGAGGNINIQTGVGGGGGGDGCGGSCNSGQTGAYGNITMQASGGNVGIGTSTPGALLHVSSTGSTDLFKVTDTSTTAQDVLKVADGGATTFRNQTNSTTAFVVQSTTAGNELFQIDTTNSRIYIGDTTADATAALLVLDTKNTAGDPTGVNGASYYNSNTNKFRCFENSAWGDCISAASTLQSAYNTDADGSDAIVALTTADDSIIIRNPASSGSDSTYPLTVDQLNTGAFGGMFINSLGTGYALRVDDSSGDTTPFVIDQNGRVGIGVTSTPGSMLQVDGPSATTAGAAATPVLQVFGGNGASVAGSAGGNGSLISLQSGNGGSAGQAVGSMNGGNGGVLTLATGSGGQGGLSFNSISAVGGVGGALSVTTGAGGGGGTINTFGGDNGGAGGAFSLTTGVGGAGSQGYNGTNAGSGANGGNITITSGTGGIGGSACPGCEDPDGPGVNGGNGGSGGTITIQGGTGGTGGPAGTGTAGTNGSYGNVILQSSGGFVGIGDATPDAKFDIDATFSPATTGTTTNTGSGLTVSNTVNKTAGTDTTYGQQLTVTRTGATGGTINTYGLDIQATGDTGGTSTLTGLNVNVSGADTNYAALFNGGYVGIGTTTPSALLSVGTGAASNFKVNADGDITSSFTTLNGSTTANGAGTNSTTLILTSATNFDVGNYVQVDPTGANTCSGAVTVCYAKITAIATNTLTISPALTWDNGAAVVEMHIPELGGVDLTQSLTNRYGRGYFIDGIVTGNGSTYFTDKSIQQTVGGSTFNFLDNGNTSTINFGTSATTTNFSGSVTTNTLNVLGPNQPADSGAAAVQTLNVVGGIGGSGADSGNGGTGSSISLASGAGGAGGSGIQFTGNNGGNGAAAGDITISGAIGGAGGNGGEAYYEEAGCGGYCGPGGNGGNGSNGGRLVLQGGAGGNAGSGASGSINGTDGTAGLFGNITLQASGGNVGIGMSSPSRKLDVTGTWGGNVSTTATSDSATTSTVSTAALAYYVQSTDTTGDCNTADKTFNITGLPSSEGTFAYIVSKATDNNCTSNSVDVTVQINGSTIGTVTAANTVNGSVTENYTVAYINGTWRIVGLNSGTAQAANGSDTADLAEWIKYTGTKPQPGDVLTVGDSTVSVKQSTLAYDSKLIGVVSTTPHTVMGTDDGQSVVLALTGRVPVKVSLEGGAIQVGDKLTSSSTPGVAMKASGAGRIIGIALDAYDGTQTGNKVMVQLGIGYNSEPTTDIQGNSATFNTLTILGDATINNLTVTNTITTKDLTVTGTATIQNLTVSGVSTLAELTVTGNAKVQGTLTVTKLVIKDTLIIESHIISRGTAPQAVLGAASGTGTGTPIDPATMPTIALDGTDTTGTISVRTATASNRGVLATIKFNKAFERTPKIVISANDELSLLLQVYVRKTADGFELVAINPAADNTTYNFDYVILAAAPTP